jgi:diguanylate cyclase (GGDEF)-like protein
MREQRQSISDQGARGKILLVGSLDKAFLDAGSIGSEHFVACGDVRHAVRAASENDFAAMAIVMTEVSGQLISALKALRNANSDTKILLLAQVHEEPIARQLVAAGRDAKTIADDYLICPLQSQRLLERMGLSTAVGKPEPVSSTRTDIDLERRIRHLEELATEDDLTGLKNRRYMWEFARQVLEHAGTDRGQVTLLLFDIDNFKHYNDVYGHSTGDQILQQAAMLMQRCCRAHDVVGRIGGDEFAVVFWDVGQPASYDAQEDRRSTETGHPKDAIFIAKRFMEELEKAEFHLLGPSGKGILTISGGLATFPRDAATVQELFQRADEALLEAKRSGKNRIYLVGKPQSDISTIP